MIAISPVFYKGDVWMGDGCGSLHAASLPYRIVISLILEHIVFKKQKRFDISLSFPRNTIFERLDLRNRGDQ
jgi:hypothetical protein